MLCTYCVFTFVIEQKKNEMKQNKTKQSKTIQNKTHKKQKQKQKKKAKNKHQHFFYIVTWLPTNSNRFRKIVLAQTYLTNYLSVELYRGVIIPSIGAVDNEKNDLNMYIAFTVTYYEGLIRCTSVINYFTEEFVPKQLEFELEILSKT